MSKPITQPGDPRILAAFHAVGASWHVVTARLESQRAVLIEARTFPQSDSAAIEAFLTSHNVGRVVGVLPASTIITRTCQLPNGSQLQLDAALRLQAESQLLGSVPAHRLATAMLHESEGEPNRTGLILGWPESAQAPIPPTSLPTTHAPVIASLAALLNGSRPDEPLLFIDREDGSMALSLTHANGAIFRSARIDTSTADHGRSAMLRSMTETALSVGHTGAFIDEVNNRLRVQIEMSRGQDSLLVMPKSMPSELATRLHGAPATSEWWSTFGIAAGIVLAASDQLAPLTQMLRQPKAVKPSRVRELSSTLSDRKIAMKLLAACVAIIVFAPVVFGGLRLLILTVRYPNLEEKLSEIESSKHSLAMYKDLKNHAWSMTKVLSDLVCSAPEGIELETIAVDHGKELRVKGVARSHKDASATDAVQSMLTNMQKYGIFKDVRPSWDSPNAQGTSYEFSMVARVDDAHKQVDYPEDLDFAAYTLAQRKYGRDAVPGVESPNAPDTAVASRPTNQGDTQRPSTTQRPNVTPRNDTPPEPVSEEVVLENGEEPPADTEVAIDEPRRGGRGALSDRTGTAGGTSTRGDSGDGPPIDTRIPEPLSEAQIAAMSQAEVQDAMASISRALKRGTALEADVRTRLNTEFRLLLARMREFG